VTDPPPIDPGLWVIPPFAEIEAHARAEVQAALDSTHRFCEGVDARDAVAMLREIDRLRDLLGDLKEALPLTMWHGLEIDDPALIRALNAALVGR